MGGKSDRIHVTIKLCRPTGGKSEKEILFYKPYIYYGYVIIKMEKYKPHYSKAKLHKQGSSLAEEGGGGLINTFEINFQTPLMKLKYPS